jgi:DNA primase
MPGHIPENILEDILSRINIVEVISEYMPLKRAGRNFKALCPFHHEKTPSFMVSPDRQIYHCFGCSESGNAFKFLMRYERMEFPEAVEILAKKAGVTLPEIKKIDDKTLSINTQLYKINELATIFYKQILNSEEGLEAKNYLLKRKLTPETIKLFQLGYAPDKWDVLISHLRAKGISLSLLEKAGLILTKESGGYYDRFRQRVIFPIFDIKSRVLGFGARILIDKDKSSPKYINSPETAIYTKGRNLYGLNLAKEAIRENDYAVIVEGYLDFIMPYQVGLQNIIASLGTALTEEQARLIKRYTHNVVMVYDADSAGLMATLRTLDIFIEEGMNVKVVSLPQGFDPDLFVREKGIGGLKERIGSAENLFEYKLKILKSQHNSREIEGKAKISQEMLPTINRFKNAVLKSEYIKRLAEELKVKEEALLEELKKIKVQKTYSEVLAPSKKEALDINPTEKLLLKLMIEENELIEHVRKHLEPGDFQDERTAQIVSIMFDLVSQGKTIEPNKLINYLDDQESLECICESVFSPDISVDHKERIVDDCIKRIKNRKIVLMRQRLQEEIKMAEELGDEKKLDELRQEFCSLIKKGK